MLWQAPPTAIPLLPGQGGTFNAHKKVLYKLWQVTSFPFPNTLVLFKYDVHVPKMSASTALAEYPAGTNTFLSFSMVQKFIFVAFTHCGGGGGGAVQLSHGAKILTVEQAYHPESENTWTVQIPFGPVQFTFGTVNVKEVATTEGDGCSENKVT